MTNARRKAIKENRGFLSRENNRWSSVLKMIPKNEWPLVDIDHKRIEVWRSNKYLVQVFNENNAMLRISVCRTMVQTNGSWVDGIKWEELQEIKRGIGRGNLCAVEVFPRDQDIVNDANMRHLWVLPENAIFGWVT